MAQVYVMGMIFDENNVPDFGSIRCTDLRGGANFKGKNQYILKSTDVSKLDLITNASDGSTAICTDTADLYILHMDEWVKFGEENEESTENAETQTQSLNVSPLNINRGELAVDRGSNDISDNLTVEPTTENLTDDTSREELI